MSIEKSIAREMIRDRISRYTISRDTDDLPAFVENFTTDAVFSGSPFALRGRAEIETYYAEVIDRMAHQSGPRFRRHHITTSQIDVTSATTAKGHVYYTVLSDLGLDHCGFYIDRYRQVDGTWLISYRGAWMDWCEPRSLYVPEDAKRLLDETGQCGPILGPDA